MYCPKCGHTQWCGCSSCKSRWPIRYWINRLKYGKPWYWPTDNDIACGGCNLTRDASWWEDTEWDVYREEIHAKTIV